MILRMTAVYENGVLRPLYPIPVMEGDRVELVIIRPEPVDMNSPEQVQRRERAVRALQELWARTDAAEDPDDGYDLLQALNENRIRQGARPLIPPETEGGAK